MQQHLKPLQMKCIETKAGSFLHSEGGTGRTSAVFFLSTHVITEKRQSVETVLFVRAHILSKRLGHRDRARIKWS